MDSRNDLTEKIQDLSDIELAILICLVAEQHCIIEANKEILDDVEHEVQLIAAHVFGLTWAVLDCDENTTLDDFGRGILVSEESDDYYGSRGAYGKAEVTGRRVSRSRRVSSPLGGHRIANFVVAKNLNRACSQVQAQALELIRGKRNYTRTAVHTAPKPFVLIALNVSGTDRLTLHLNDQFFISHRHLAEDGLINLEDAQAKDPVLDDDASTSSVVRSSPYMPMKRRPSSVLISHEELNDLVTLTAEVKISSEVRAYLNHILVFMRLHRAVAGGISALATRHFNTLSRVLAPLHGLLYVSPSLVALAARKIYPHRIIITEPENERSMQWGSSLEAVKAVLEGVAVEDVIEEVLQSVEAPL